MSYNQLTALLNEYEKWQQTKLKYQAPGVFKDSLMQQSQPSKLSGFSNYRGTNWLR